MRAGDASGSFASRRQRAGKDQCTMPPPPYRKGNLHFICVDTWPNETFVARPGMVILPGKATRHAHRLTRGAILEAPIGDLYLDLAEAARIIHEEHDAISLGPGFWRVIRQQEYTPAVPRPVSD